MKLSQEKIDRKHRISDRCIKGIIFGGIVVLFLKPGIWFWVSLGLLMVSVAFVIFVAGFELGHRRGYDKGWRDCTFDAKEMVHPVNDDMFWKWYDSANSVTRKRRSFFE